MFPAIFLDRDGVVIENLPDYVRRWDQVEIYPQALQALARLNHSPYRIVLVTNQAGIGKGLIHPEDAGEINRRLCQAVEAAGGRIDGIYVCPHTPEAGCECRKPRPGLVLQAAGELDLDLKRSILIGDAMTDLQAGQAAGVGRVALVRTGRGAAQAAQALAASLPVFEDLDEALRRLLLS